MSAVELELALRTARLDERERAVAIREAQIETTQIRRVKSELRQKKRDLDELRVNVKRNAN